VCTPGVDYSVNVKTTATTLCAATNIPYLQNFETSVPPTGLPTCTSMQDVNGNSGPDANVTGGRWTTFAGTSGDTYVSPTNVIRYLYDLPMVTRPADDWFFIQGLNLTAGNQYRLKFYYKASDGPTWTERIEVKYGTSAQASAMTNTLFTDNNIDGALANPWDSAVVDFTPPTTDVYYIGFHAMSLADQAFLYMDDISVRVAPKVDVGVTGITTPNLTCPANGVFVQATIRNYNTTTLDFAQYPIGVNAAVTGASTGTLSTTLTSGTLAPGASMTVYLNPAHNFVGGTHNLKVWTVSADDPEVGNDTLLTTINVNPNPPQPVITPASAAICIGGPAVLLSTQFTNPPPPPVTLPAVSSGAITVNVPDANAGGITHSLNVTGVPAGAVVTGVSVNLNMTHTWISDMVINLKAPNNSIINLFNARGGLGDNLVNTVISSASTNSLAAGTAPFTGTFAADMAVGVGPTSNSSTASSWNSLYTVGNGAWTLALRDLAAGDPGSLTSWSITISYQLANPVVTWTPNTSLFTNAGATTAYTGGDAFTVYARPTTTTTYTATATTSAGCTSSRTVTVSVNPLPDIQIGATPDTVCTSDGVIQLPATPVGGTWSGIGVSGNTFIPSATAVGTYTLTYSFTTLAGCTSTATRQIAVKDCPERIIRLIDDAVLLYPNPNTGQFNISINSTLYSYLTMKVYSNTGQLVHTKQLSGLTYGRVIPIDLRNLPGGTYMVQFYYDGGVRTSQKTFKVIIANP
jgi:subtilisin-like proprotein convertase family protein